MTCLTRAITQKRPHPTAILSLPCHFFFYCDDDQACSRVARLHYVTMMFGLRCRDGNALSLFSFITITHLHSQLWRKISQDWLFLFSPLPYLGGSAQIEPSKSQNIKYLEVVFHGVDPCRSALSQQGLAASACVFPEK